MKNNKVTSDLIRQFEREGLIKLPRLISKDELGPVKQQILNELKRLKIFENHRVLSRKFQQLEPFQQIAGLSQSVSKPQSLDRIFVSIFKVLSGLTHVALSPAITSQLLLSLPKQGVWNFDRLNWHVDTSSRQFQGIQAFLLIDDIEPCGGATLALSGSHLLNPRPSLQSLIHLTKDRQVGQSVQIDNANMLIHEMSGQAGDVYFMDMRVLHTPSINSSKNLRMMATSRFFVQ